jgi:hypothetical protein
VAAGGRAWSSAASQVNWLEVDQALGRQQGEQPGGDVHRAAVALVLGVGDLRSQPRLVGGELRAGRGAAGGQRTHRGLARLFEPDRPVGGDARRLDDLAKLAPHALGDLVRARGLDHRHQLGRYDEHRPAHAEHPDHRALLVQRLLDCRFVDVTGPGPGGQVHRRRVGAVQANQVRRHGRDRPGPFPWRQMVPDR